MTGKNTDPTHIDISLSQGVDITWGDGHKSHYPLDHLRQNCPCASCRSEEHSSQPSSQLASPLPVFKPTARLTNAEAVGRYAVRLLWTDGHSTGLYSFDHLREICPCPECAPSG